MLAFQLKASVPPTEFSSSAMSCGLGAPRCPTCSNFRMGACGGQKAFRQNQIERKCLVIQPLKRLERTRTVNPPLQRNFALHKRDHQHPFSLSRELSRSHAGWPFVLGYSSRYEPSISPSIRFSPTLVLKGRNAFLAENCKLRRPRVNYPTSSLPTVKDQKSELRRCGDGLSYPDPIVGASRLFLHRISELSSLEVETIRQEKRMKMKKTPKPPS